MGWAHVCSCLVCRSEILDRELNVGGEASSSGAGASSGSGSGSGAGLGGVYGGAVGALVVGDHTYSADFVEWSLTQLGRWGPGLLLIFLVFRDCFQTFSIQDLTFL
jgi:hypothetical protein